MAIEENRAKSLERGRMFPPLYGDGPADNDPGEDITNTPLEPLSGRKDPFALSDMAQRSDTVSFAKSEPYSSFSEPQSPEAQPPTPTPEGNRRTFRDRLSQVIGQRNELRQDVGNAQSRIENQQQELAGLREDLKRTQDLLLAMGGTRAGGHQPAPRSDVLDEFLPSSSSAAPQEQRPEAGGANMLGALSHMIDQKLNPLVDRINQQDSQAALNRAHEQSLLRVNQEFPELLANGSAQNQAFVEAWQALSAAGDPITRLENGPERVALMVRGMLVDDRAREVQQDERRRAAQLHTPAPQPTDQLADAARDQTVQRVYDEAARRRRMGSTSFEDYAAMRKAGRISGRSDYRPGR